MKSGWIVVEHGKSRIQFRDVPVPQAGPGQVLLKVHAAGLNRGELIVGSVVHGGPEKLGGIEAAGVVEAVGEGVADLKAGDRVMGRGGGAFAEYVSLDARQVVPLPGHLSWEQGAAIPTTYLTAYELVCMYGKLKAGEWLLVTGISSGVGVAALHIARMLGAKVIGTSGSAEKLARLEGEGLDVGIATRGPDFAERVMEATDGHGADVVVNCVGGSVFAECIKAMARRGRLGIVGYVDGVLKADLDLSAVHAGRLEIFGVSNARMQPDERAESMRGFVRDVLPAIVDGRITPVVDRVYPFDDLPAAKERIESNAHVGKIVVTMGDGGEAGRPE
jgi:NADPH:quinone reductase-like Zn-dependent oxidoreductase